MRLEFLAMVLSWCNTPRLIAYTLDACAVCLDAKQNPDRKGTAIIDLKGMLQYVDCTSFCLAVLNAQV